MAGRTNGLKKSPFCNMKRNKLLFYRLDMPRGLIVKKIKHKSRGVFAKKKFLKNEVIERSPVIVLNKKDSYLCEKTILDHYLFAWKNNQDGAIALGYGSLYNHSYHPNAFWEHDYRKRELIFRALKDIKKSEEITTNYNHDPKDKSPIRWIKKIY